MSVWFIDVFESNFKMMQCYRWFHSSRMSFWVTDILLIGGFLEKNSSFGAWTIYQQAPGYEQQMETQYPTAYTIIDWIRFVSCLSPQNNGYLPRLSSWYLPRLSSWPCRFVPWDQRELQQGGKVCTQLVPISAPILWRDVNYHGERATVKFWVNA